MGPVRPLDASDPSFARLQATFPLFIPGKWQSEAESVCTAALLLEINFSISYQYVHDLNATILHELASSVTVQDADANSCRFVLGHLRHDCSAD